MNLHRLEFLMCCVEAPGLYHSAQKKLEIHLKAEVDGLKQQRTTPGVPPVGYDYTSSPD